MTKDKEDLFPATVVEVEDDFRIAINRGSNHGMVIGKRFAIYGLSEEEIKDPETGESLGKLEIFKGAGKITNVQEKMSTIESTEKKPVRKEVFTENTNPFNRPLFSSPTKKVIEFPEEPLPFRDPEIGDKAKPI